MQGRTGRCRPRYRHLEVFGGFRQGAGETADATGHPGPGVRARRTVGSPHAHPVHLPPEAHAGLRPLALPANRLRELPGKPRGLSAPGARPVLELPCVAGPAVAVAAVDAGNLGLLPRALVAVTLRLRVCRRVHRSSNSSARSRRRIMRRTSFRSRGPRRRPGRCVCSPWPFSGSCGSIRAIAPGIL